MGARGPRVRVVSRRGGDRPACRQWPGLAPPHARRRMASARARRVRGRAGAQGATGRAAALGPRSTGAGGERAAAAARPGAARRARPQHLADQRAGQRRPAPARRAARAGATGARRRSRRRATTRCASCAPRSTCCATQSMRPDARRLALPTSTSSSTACAPAVSRCASSEAPPTRFRPAVELAAYRIVQEALTNVTRHAARAVGRPCAWHDGDDLCIEVLDDGVGGSCRRPATASPACASGRPRSAAPSRPGRATAGGFRVVAHLPVPTRLTR